MSQHRTPDNDPHLTPLEVVECLIARLQDLGRIAGSHDKSPYHWRSGSAWRDPGDLPPRVNRRLLAYAARRQLPLLPEHLIWGGRWSDVEALAAQAGRHMPAHLRDRYFPEAAGSSRQQGLAAE